MITAVFALFNIFCTGYLMMAMGDWRKTALRAKEHSRYWQERCMYWEKRCQEETVEFVRWRIKHERLQRP